VKKTKRLLSAVMACLLMQSSHASEVQTKIQSLFGNKSVVISNYDAQLKKVLVDGSNIYFTTHDGRYLFAGPILDTQQKTNIVSEQENQLRQTYLNSVPEDVFVSYPSHAPSKHQITVFTDIDCPYCRKFHDYITNFNQQGVSVNYVMLPRSGVGTKSHKKTISALCSDNPADSITRAMRSEEPTPNNCKSSVMSQHMKIV
jgi:thiol:disulfide interchange protein DsbC